MNASGSRTSRAPARPASRIRPAAFSADRGPSKSTDAACATATRNRPVVHWSGKAVLPPSRLARSGSRGVRAPERLAELLGAVRPDQARPEGGLPEVAEPDVEGRLLGGLDRLARRHQDQEDQVHRLA